MGSGGSEACGLAVEVIGNCGRVGERDFVALELESEVPEPKIARSGLKMLHERC